MRVELEPGAFLDLSDTDRAAGLYSILALLLFVGLILVALPAETGDERLLRTGSVIMTIGLSAWLPLRGLLVAVLLLWLTPFITREILGEADRIGWSEAGELLALTFLAVGFRYIYVATRGLLGRLREGVAGAPVLAETRPSPLGETRSTSVTPSLRSSLSQRPLLTAGARISQTDAEGILIRLSVLDVEVLETGHQVRWSQGILNHLR
jgi:hypothetical protein